MSLGYPEWFAVRDVFYIDASKLFEKSEIKDTLEANRVLAHRDENTPTKIAARLDVAIHKATAFQNVLLFGFLVEETLDPGADGEPQEVWVGGFLFWKGPKKSIPFMDTMPLTDLQKAFYDNGGMIFFMRPLERQKAMCSMALTVANEKLKSKDEDEIEEVEAK